MEQKIDIINILRTTKTVFSTQDILLNNQEARPDLLKRRINYYVKKGLLYSIRRGIYAKDKNYNKFELANKLYSPSYISFETVLAKEAMIFQYYSQIFIASYLSREIKIGDQSYAYRRIKKEILLNQQGVEIYDNYYIASKERAFLDVVYLNTNYHFDNLDALDWDKVFNLVPIYNNKRMAKKVDRYYKNYKQNK